MSGNDSIEIGIAPGEKCQRCRKYSLQVGLCAEHPTLCLRCAAVVMGSEMDVHAFAAARYDRLYRAAREAGLSHADACRAANVGNREPLPT